MGREARVLAQIGEWSGEGKLLLEMDELIFRGAKRHAIHVSEITSTGTKDGWLTVIAGGVEARFDLGDYSEKWLHAIRNPRTRVDKFDVKATSRTALVDVRDEVFAAEVEARAPDTVRGSVAELASSQDPFDLVVLHAMEPAVLSAIAQLRPLMRSTGALWVIHPKGRADLSHDAVMAAARPLGLIDVKSARVDEDNAALKLMLPRKAR